MKKKAQAGAGLGIILMMFIAVLVGVVLFQTVAQEASKGTATPYITNISVGTIANNTASYIAYRSITGVVIMNGTNGGTIVAANYTVVNNVINPTNGEISVSITPTMLAKDATGLAGTWFISGTTQPQTYIADGGSRAVVGLIAIFFALAIAVIALEPTLRNGVLNMGK